MNFGWGFTEYASVRGLELDVPYGIFQHSNFVPFSSKIKKRESQEGRGSKNLGWLAPGQTSSWCILTMRGVLLAFGWGVEVGSYPTPPLTWPQMKSPGDVRGRRNIMREFLPKQLCIHFSKALAQAGVWLWFESDLFAFLQQAASVTGCKGRDLHCT